MSLFNATSGVVNPDYVAVMLNAKWTIVPTIAAAITLIAGLWLLWRDRQYWWKTWLKERALGWAVLFSIAAVAVFIVIPTQRPRPSYLFSLTIFLMVSIGMSLFIIFHRWTVLSKIKLLIPVIAVALLVAVPNYYTDSGRPLLSFYNRFQPFQDIFERRNTIFLTREFSQDLCLYLVHSEQCKPLNYASSTFFAGVPETIPLDVLLRKQKVKIFYVDETLLSQLQSNPSTAAFLTDPESKGWKLLAMQDGGNDRWMLFRKLTKKERQQNASANGSV